MTGGDDAATRFATVPPFAARAGLLAVAALCVFGVASGGGRAETRASDGRAIDTGLYEAIVARVHAGDAYYDAAGEELRSRSFATRPFWNWRLPTLAWFTAALPEPERGRLVLAAAGLAALLLWVPLLRARRGLAAALAGGLLLLGGLLPTLSATGFYFHEMWAGTAIALSLAAWGLGARAVAWAAGLLAVFVRELALPYLVVMAGLAWLERDRREAAAWLSAVALFAVGVAVHGVVVSARLGPDELRNASWLALGGWPFVLQTARWNALLLIAPPAAVALAVPLCVLGLAGWRSPLGARAALTVGIYLAAFTLVGRPDNTYWGLLYAPLLPLGLVFAPAALRDLVRRALGRDATGTAAA